MNTLKTVFGKLFKEETQLTAHEVELASIQELKKIIYSYMHTSRLLCNHQMQLLIRNLQIRNFVF